MALINLHNHSNFSDGTLSPAKLAALAGGAGIGYFSLTDHDSVSGWEEMEPALKERGIKFCYGVELTTNLTENMHILGYGVDPKDEAFKKSLDGFRAKRIKRVEEIIEKLKLNCGITLSFDELKVPPGKTVGRPHIARLLCEKGYASSRKKAFERFLIPGKPAYVPPNGPTVEEAVLTIKKAGGAAVWAHPGAVAKTQVENLGAWKECGLEGLEAFYPAHTKACIRRFVELAESLGLFVTAGIDFHGPGTDRDKMTGYPFEEKYFSAVERFFI